MTTLIILVFFLNLIFFLFQEKYYRFLNIYDLPDKTRKTHTEPVPLIGGSIILFNVILYFFITNLGIIDPEIFYNSKTLNFFFIVACLSFFLLGLVDDRKELGPNTKLSISILILILLMYANPSSIISSIYINVFEINYSLGVFAIPFTLLCYLLFINAFNMFDGINMQSGVYALNILIIFLLNHTFQVFSFFLIIGIIFFLLKNMQGKIFFGDNGTLLLGFIISYLFIVDYNLSETFSIEEIFILMSLPGFELLRVTIIRIINKKHPFSPDRLHLHHFLISRISNNKSIFVLVALSILPYLISLIINDYLVIALSAVLYLSVLLFFQRKL